MMAQNAPCIRNYKETKALKARGHLVDLATFANRLHDYYQIEDGNEVYDRVIPLHAPEDLLDIAEWYDVVHCHNEPDTFAAIMTVSDVPSVHDCHDAMSIRGLGFNRVEEALANRFSDGAIYVSGYQADKMQERYGERMPYEIFNSFVLAEHVPDEVLPKIGLNSGEIHFVYEGGINTVSETHRYLLEIFRELLRAGAWIHVYGLSNQDYRSAYMAELDSPRLVFHNPLHPGDLIREMSRYDVGLCAFNVTEANKHHLHSTLPNKLFEYLAAGLPVMASPLIELQRFVDKHRCGFIYDGDGEQAIARAKMVVRACEIDRHAWTVEKHIERLEGLYDYVGATERRSLTLEFPPLKWAVDEARKSMTFSPSKGSKMVRRSLVGLNPSEETLRLESIIANNAGGDL